MDLCVDARLASQLHASFCSFPCYEEHNITFSLLSKNLISSFLSDISFISVCEVGMNGILVLDSSHFLASSHFQFEFIDQNKHAAIGAQKQRKKDQESEYIFGINGI